MSYWNEPIVERSWSVLLDLRKRHEFILIGGWAVYLHTGALKSKDIDLVVEHSTLSEMMASMEIRKNDRLRKYEADAGGVSIDIYLPYYSRLAVPPEDIGKGATVIKGFRVPALEVLLALKQTAELDRGGSVKGMKDRVDILSILLSGKLDVRRYALMLKGYGLGYLGRLREIVRDAGDEFRYLGITDLREIRKRRRALLDAIDAARA